MRSLLALLLYIIFYLSLSQAATHTYKWAAVNSWSGFGYYEYIPDSHNSTSGVHPVIVHLHGAGERGNGNASEITKVLNFGIAKLIKNNQWPAPFNFIVISPQEGVWWSPNQVCLIFRPLLSFLSFATLFSFIYFSPFFYSFILT